MIDYDFFLENSFFNLSVLILLLMYILHEKIVLKNVENIIFEKFCSLI